MQRNETNDYGMSKIVPPMFIEVELQFPWDVVSSRLKNIGRTFRNPNEIVQVAHILKKRDKYYLCHFKSLLYLDGVIPEDAIQEKDLCELSFAVQQLQGLGYVNVIDRLTRTRKPPPHVKDVTDSIVPWRRVVKYTFKKPH